MTKIKNLVEEEFIPITMLGKEEEKLKVSENEGGIFLDISGKLLWINGSRRHFIEDDYIEVFAEELDEIVILAVDLKAAWDIDAEILRDICNKYTVDMKIYAFECGMEFNRDIEIIRGVITKNSTINFDDYKWQCISPNRGG